DRIGKPLRKCLNTLPGGLWNIPQPGGMLIGSMGCTVRVGAGAAPKLRRSGTDEFHAFQREEPRLDLLAESEAGEGAIRADHAMAGHDQADRIRRIGAAHCSWGTAQFTREFTIRSGLAAGNPAKLCPDALLEVRPFSSEWQIELSPQT